MILQYLRQFFVWCDDTGYAGWEGPRKLTKPFDVRLEDLLMPQEKRKADDGPEHLTLDEIKKLYQAGTDWQRTLLLLGLFCGLGQTEISHLGQEEFDLNAPLLTHRRHKTGIMGCYWLPPELVNLLKKQLPKMPKNKHNLTFLGDDGHG